MTGLQIILSLAASFTGAFIGTVAALFVYTMRKDPKPVPQEEKKEPFKPRIVGSVLPDWERRKTDS